MNNNKKYNIGLDIGTSSVGWAVVEADTQKIIRKGKGKNRKALWGVRLFEEAKTAANRRSFRSTRRRYDRRRQRTKLLQEEFNTEIMKVDSTFFQKLQESKYNEKDSINKKIPITKEEKELIKAYNKKYKTIYHLRKRLIEDPSKEDIRLVYLAIHHIIKYRGNFLYQGENFSISNMNLYEYFDELFESIIKNNPQLNFPSNYKEIIDYKKLEEIILNQSKNDVKEGIKEIFKDLSDNKKFAQELGKIFVGNEANIETLLMLEDLEQRKISFSSTNYDENYEKLNNCLGDSIEIIDILKNIYDTVFLKKLFKNSDNTLLSDEMVKKYKEHEEDLRFLKNLFKDNRN